MNITFGKSHDVERNIYRVVYFSFCLLLGEVLELVEDSGVYLARVRMERREEMRREECRGLEERRTGGLEGRGPKDRRNGEVEVRRIRGRRRIGGRRRIRSRRRIRGWRRIRSRRRISRRRITGAEKRRRQGPEGWDWERDGETLLETKSNLASITSRSGIPTA
jgi:hypothetical protein